MKIYSAITRSTMEDNVDNETCAQLPALRPRTGSFRSFEQRCLCPFLVPYESKFGQNTRKFFQQTLAGRSSGWCKSLKWPILPGEKESAHWQTACSG